MDLRLSLGKPPKACQRSIADWCRKVSGGDELGDHTPLPHPNISCDHLDRQAVCVLPGTRHGVAAQRDRVTDHRVNGPLYDGQIRTGIDQGAQQHIAGDPRRGIDPELPGDAHGAAI